MTPTLKLKAVFARLSLPISVSAIANSGIRISKGQILRHSEYLGEFLADTPYMTTKSEYLKLTRNDSRIAKVLSVLQVPDKFRFVFVDTILIKPEFRGLGIGKEAFEVFFRTLRRPCLVVLNPGEITSGKSKTTFSVLKKFYRSLGFTIIKDQDSEYLAFKLLKE